MHVDLAASRYEMEVSPFTEMEGSSCRKTLNRSLGWSDAAELAVRRVLVTVAGIRPPASPLSRAPRRDAPLTYNRVLHKVLARSLSERKEVKFVMEGTLSFRQRELVDYRIDVKNGCGNGGGRTLRQQTPTQ